MLVLRRCGVFPLQAIYFSDNITTKVKSLHALIDGGELEIIIYGVLSCIYVRNSIHNYIRLTIPAKLSHIYSACDSVLTT